MRVAEINFGSLLALAVSDSFRHLQFREISHEFMVADKDRFIPGPRPERKG